MIGISLDHGRCTGCELCSLACATRFDAHGFNRRLSAIRVHVVGIMDADVPVVCMQCEDAPCQAACPEGAFYWVQSTGALAIDGEKCSSCGNCIPACPYGAIHQHQSRAVPIKCDLCDGDPICVRYCVPGAITLSPTATWSKEHRADYFQVLDVTGGSGR
jgi:anaerobic carbon-monoxide dehydrogenase iron sulfur subunit